MDEQILYLALDKSFVMKHKIAKMALIAAATVVASVWYERTVFQPMLNEKYREQFSDD